MRGLEYSEQLRPASFYGTMAMPADLHDPATVLAMLWSGRCRMCSSRCLILAIS